jgi:hypothetical protein
MTRIRARQFGFTLASVALVLGLAVLERLNTALSAMHRAGDVSAGYGSVASASALWSPESTRDLIRAWRDWDADRLAAGLAGHFVGPYQAVWAYALLHFFLIAVPVTVLFRLVGSWTVERIQRRQDQPQEQVTDPSRIEALKRIAQLARGGALGYLVLTGVVDLMVPLAVRFDAPTVLVVAIGLGSLLALVVLALVAVPMAFADLATIPLEGPGYLTRVLGTGIRNTVAVRAQLIAALLIAATIVVLQGDIGLQIDDVAMRWIEHWPAAVLAIVAACFTAWLMLLSGEVNWYRYRRARPAIEPISRRMLILLGVAGLALIAAWFVLANLLDQRWADLLVWPGAVLVAFAALSLPQKVHTVTVEPAAPAPAADTGPAPLPVRVLAAIPLAALGLIAARAATTLTVSLALKAWWLVAVALVALAGAVLVVAWPLPTRPGRLSAGSTLLAGTAVTVAAAVAVGVWPIVTGQAVGAIALLFLFASVLVLGLTGLALLGEAWTPGGALALLGLRRVPVLTFFAAWFAVTSAIGGTSRYHEVRLAGPLPGAAAAVTVEQALDAWVKQHPAVGSAGRQQVPMLFVSAAGGGIRAAYWTAMVLDCLFAVRPVQQECAGDPLDRSAVFAESGISGGSVGLTFDRVLAGTGRTFADVLDRDFVSPDVAALGFRDAPMAWLRLQPYGVDRAAVLEQAWERAAGSPSPLRTGLFADSRDAQGHLRFPLLLLNGATVDDGCRLNGSVLTASVTVPRGPALPTGTDDCLSLTSFEPGRADPAGNADSTLAATKDLYDFLCPPGGKVRHDIALSTAALLSARFPYISPTGALNSCGDPQRRTYDIDGGLVEASGLSAITEMWAHIAGRVQAINDNPDGTVCIQPRLLMIDNSYLQASPGTAPAQPQELLAPIEGRSRVNSLRSAQAEQAAALAFDRVFGGTTCAGLADATQPLSRVAHVVPTARPGPQAPLGWSLSRFARDDLEEQLNSPTNRCEIELVRSWFRANPTPDTGFCLTGFAVRSPDLPVTGPATLASFVGPTTGFQGVAGVRLTASGCVQTPRTACSVTTDASGRYSLLLKPGQGSTMKVEWGGAKALTLPVPDHPDFVDTSFNVFVTGKAGTSSG